jgi:NTP pyrophosphatase (non-canonical NTP hydrolase)
MDMITTAIIAALANLSDSVIKDAYQALKGLITQKFGESSEVAQAVEKVEKKPSKPRQAVLEEEITTAKADQDNELIQAAEKLLELVRQAQQMSQPSPMIQQKAGDRSTQIGTVGGDVHIQQK